MSSSNIIKDYNYVGESETPRVSRLAIFVDGDFDEPNLPIFRLGDEATGDTPEGLFRKPSSLPNSTKPGIHHPNGNISNHHTKPPTIPEIDPIEKLKDEYERKLKRENQESYLRGLSEGRKQGVAEWTPQAQRISQALEKAMAALSKRYETNLEALEKSIGDLSVFLAEKIVGEAVNNIPDIVKGNVEKCLKLLAGAGNVVVKINPGDYEVIKAHMPSLLQRYEGKFAFHLEPMQNISPGGCVLELDGSLIDGRIEAQLENIKQHIKILS